MSVLKIKDGNSWVNIPASGVGVPLGGNAGEVLTKATSTDYDAGWVLPLSMKLLWTNSNPSTSFAAQTVSLDLSGYDAVYILARNVPVTDTQNSLVSMLALKGQASSLVVTSRLSNNTGARRFTATDTGVAFEYCGYNGQTNNDVLVPYKIYGIKGIT